MQVEYNTGNIEKYRSKNPLKRAMVERLNKKILDSLDNMIGSKGALKILDAGCGEGFVDRLLVDRFSNIEITGIEFTHEAIEIARRSNPTVDYIQGDICELPFETRSFDIVICTEVLEHIPNPDRALKELIRVSSGYLLISVPHEPWFRLGNLLVLKNVTRLGNPIDHINHWTIHSFKKFINNVIMGGWRLDSSFPWIIASRDVY